MSVAIRLRNSIDSIVIDHREFNNAFSRLDALLERRLAGVGPGIEVLIGPSRSGKTEVLKALADKYPDAESKGKRTKPVLFVPILPGTAPKDLPVGVIQALGVPVPRERSRAGTLFELMLKKLELAGTRAILFDEASHLVDVGRKIPLRQASDWFKTLFDRAQVSLVLSGVFRLQRLLESNEQLEGRSRAPLVLLPYRWDLPEDRKQFAGCAQAFIEVFVEHGCPIETGMPIDTLMRNLYVISAGHVGLLVSFFDELADHVVSAGPIRVEHMQHACSKLRLPGSDIWTPFADSRPLDEHLIQILTAQLAKHDFALPVTSPHGELAAHRERVRRKEQV